jgi:hypothetical protein
MVGGTNHLEGTGIAIFVPSTAADSDGYYAAAIEVSSNVSNDNDAYGLTLTDIGGLGDTYNQISIHDNSAAHNGIADIPEPFMGTGMTGVSSVSVDVTGNRIVIQGTEHTFFGYAVQQYDYGTLGTYPLGFQGPYPLIHKAVPDSLIIRENAATPVVQDPPTGIFPNQVAASPRLFAYSTFRTDYTVAPDGLSFTLDAPAQTTNNSSMWVTYRYIL